MKTLIVEDELSSREILKDLLATFCPELSVEGEATTVAEALPLIKKIEPDIVFLDIELPQENGFALFKYFNPLPFKVILITAYDEYAIRALRLSATDYLLKPINVQELQSAIKKVQASTHTQAQSEQLKVLVNNFRGLENRLGIATFSGYEFINVSDIIRCEANGKYTTFFLKNNQKILTSKNIGEYESILDPFHFFRVHRSHLVNINQIKQYVRGKSPSLILEDGSSIIVSPNKKDKLLALLKLG